MKNVEAKNKTTLLANPLTAVSDKVTKFDWILLIIVSVLMFISVGYLDTRSLTVWSTDFLDAIANGSFRSRFLYTLDNPHNLPSGGSGGVFWLTSVAWTGWNIPIWIAQRFFGVEISTSAVCLAWSKLYLLVVESILLRYTYKITFLLTGDKEKSRWSVFLAASSAFMIISNCHAGQDDIFMIAASVAAVYYLLNGSWKKFIILSAVSIALTPFYLVAFLGIILLTEKNVLRIALWLLIAVSGIIFQVLVFIGAPGYAEACAANGGGVQFEEIFEANISTAAGKVSFFGVALVLIYFWAYTRVFTRPEKNKDNVEYGKYVIFVISAVYLAYILFSRPATHYRPLILMPYLAILLVQNSKNFSMNVLLSTIFDGALLLGSFIRGMKILCFRDMNYSIMSLIAGKSVNTKNPVYIGIGQIMTTKIPLLGAFMPLFGAIILTAAILMLWLNNPVKEKELPFNIEKCPKALIWGRCLLTLPFTLLAMYAFAKYAV